MNQPPLISVEELIDEFDALGDWEGQCDFLIDLGFELEKLPPEAKVEENRVHGCQSNVWLIAEFQRPDDADEIRVNITAESDAMIVNGLIAILLAVYSGKSPSEILKADVEGIFTRLGLDRHLSSQRRNGLFGMVKRIRAIAAQAA